MIDFFPEGASPHDCYQGPYIYGAPEGFAMPNEVVNSAKTDLYSLGVIIASMYCDVAYEPAARDNKSKGFGNWVLESRKFLDDVLGCEVFQKPGIPDGLLKMLQHITQVDPVDRPENIACAKGIESIDVLADLVHMQLSAEKCIQILVEYAGIPEKMRQIIQSSSDIPTIKRRLLSLSKDFKVNSENDLYLKSTIELMDSFCQQQVDNLRGVKRKSVSVPDVAKLLQEKAEFYRSPRRSGLSILSREKIGFKSEGKILCRAAKRIEMLDTTEDVLCELLRTNMALKKIRVKSEKKKEKRDDEMHGFIQEVQCMVAINPLSSQFSSPSIGSFLLSEANSNVGSSALSSGSSSVPDVEEAKRRKMKFF